MIVRLVHDAGGEQVRVFGSVARGDDHEGSDVDLLFVMRRPLSLMELGRLEGEVSAAVGVPVDLVPESSLRPALRDRALAEAVPLVRRRQPRQVLQEAMAHVKVVADDASGDLRIRSGWWAASPSANAASSEPCTLRRRPTTTTDGEPGGVNRCVYPRGVLDTCAGLRARLPYSPRPSRCT